MKKFVLSIAALAALGFLVPYAAPAKAEDTVVIKRHHGDRDRDSRRHWRGEEHRKIVVIKHRRGHHHDYD